MSFSREFDGLKSDVILVYKLSVMERFARKIEIGLNNHQQFCILQIYDFEAVTLHVEY